MIKVETLVELSPFCFALHHQPTIRSPFPVRIDLEPRQNLLYHCTRIPIAQVHFWASHLPTPIGEEDSSNVTV